MDRVLIAAALIVVAVVVAVIIQRRRTDPPVRSGWVVPDQLDRADFPRPEAPWLVVVFTSSTCSTCTGVWDKARLLDSDEVVAVEAEAVERKDLHDRYEIDAVPMVVIADALGVVRAHFLGPVTATDLWARVADLREPGVLPGECHSEAPQS